MNPQVLSTGPVEAGEPFASLAQADSAFQDLEIQDAGRDLRRVAQKTSLLEHPRQPLRRARAYLRRRIRHRMTTDGIQLAYQ